MAGTLTKAGRYQIVSELGRGSMGVVYRGFDPVIGRTVAIKTMLVEGLPPSEFEEYKQRFQREAQSAGVLTHPNIVTVYDFGEDAGVLYLAMEFLEGKSIQQLVEKHNVMPIETLLPMYEQICGALDHAHQHKIVHRDIKPANIMILESGLVKVTDFGIAKVMSMGMTQAGQILGTPNYMSPEQVKGRSVDGRSDIFSLGVILYELVTGEKPFGGQNITTVIYKIINEDPIPPRQLDATISPGLSYVIQKSLAKSPDERYQTCRELAEDLRNYKNLGGISTPNATVVIRVPPIVAQQVEPALPSHVEPRIEQRFAPPAVQPRVTPPEVEPRRVQAPPPAPAPREPRPPVAAPVISAPRPQQKSSSSAVSIILGIILIAVLGGGGYYYYNFIYLPQQQGKETSTSTGVPAGGTTSSTTAATPKEIPGSTVSATNQPGATSTQPPATEASTAQPSNTPSNTTDNSTTTTASTKNGRVSVTSNVKGASISVDGQSTRWVTPHTLDLPAGQHEISISKDGVNSEKVTVDVQGGRPISKKLELAEAAQPAPAPKSDSTTPATTTAATGTAPANPPVTGGEGKIAIFTTPPGLEVTIDGKVVGASPQYATLPTGDHTFSVKCPNLDPQIHTFKIKAGGGFPTTVKCPVE
jgi:serine/threonine protein kinase